ncbi:MAG: putative toxin-antitoxin system toxin component, PIN family [Bacillota bacterium]
MKSRFKPKVVIDTNIFINSWFDNEPYCDQITALVDDNKLRLMFSQDMIGELFYIAKKYAIKHMSSEKPRLALLYNISDIIYKSESVNTINTICATLEDVYDEMFLKCAIEGKADFLISNDFKSGLHNTKNLKTTIINSSDFINLYNTITSKTS